MKMNAKRSARSVKPPMMGLLQNDPREPEGLVYQKQAIFNSAFKHYEKCTALPGPASRSTRELKSFKRPVAVQPEDAAE
jgi:hypothetical protein